MIIEVNDKQARLIAMALEEHSRMICGQLSETYIPALEHALMKEYYYKNKEKGIDNAMSIYCERRDELDSYLLMIKRIVFPNLHINESYGIGHDEVADLGYEMYKMILYTFEKRKMKEKGESYSRNRHSSQPLKLTDEPLIKITDK